VKWQWRHSVARFDGKLPHRSIYENWLEYADIAKIL